jgi:peptidoglycan/xylan/chitin deacetylase (PgdA/CDA1 family)
MSVAERYQERAAEIGELLSTRPLVRAINFHNTSRDSAEVIEKQLALCSRHFSTVTEDDLDAYLSTGLWHKPKPGMILAFYEGYRNGYDVVLPLLEKYRLTGWFFVITGFIDTSPGEQLQYADRHGIGMGSREYDDGRYALNWNELKELDRSHVVASHALSHEELAPMDEAARLAEVVGSQETFVRNLGHPVRTFVSRGGPAYGDHQATDRLIDAAGYQFVVSNFRIQRIREWPPAAAS